MAKPFIMSAIFQVKPAVKICIKKFFMTTTTATIPEVEANATREERRAADKESSEWHKGRE